MDVEFRVDKVKGDLNTITVIIDGNEVGVLTLKRLDALCLAFTLEKDDSINFKMYDKEEEE